ncbi:MAG: winged helix-turn-helix domain-containing protein [Thermoprotei archaeon]
MSLPSPPDVNLEQELLKLINSIEDAPILDMDELGNKTGLGGEAKLLYRHYVAEKGLLAKSSVNFFKLGLIDAFAIVQLTPQFAKKAPEFIRTAMESNFIVGTIRPMGQNIIIGRVLVPLSEFQSIKKVFDELCSSGIVDHYEIFQANGAGNRFSLHPSAFDYTVGSWKPYPSTPSVNRQFKTPDVNPEKFDETDLKILLMLKRSAAIKGNDIALSLGISVEEANAHIKEHVLGGGNQNRSLVMGSFVDFFEPGLFAPQTAVIAAFFRPEGDARDAFLSELLKMPYLNFLVPCHQYFYALFYFPIAKLYALANSIEEAQSKCAMADSRYYVAPWFSANKYGDPHNTADLSRSFVKGKWKFNADQFLEAIVASAKGYR